MHGYLRALAGVLMLALVGLVHAHDKAHGTHAATDIDATQTPWGLVGAKPQRTIRVAMLDTMRFAPDRVDVKRGETVRFVIRNDGAVLHEFVLGTQAAIDEHADMMVKHPDMQHEADHLLHVSPGKDGEIVWTFNRVGQFYYACLIAGHYQAGMVGTVIVK